MNSSKFCFITENFLKNFKENFPYKLPTVNFRKLTFLFFKVIFLSVHLQV